MQSSAITHKINKTSLISLLVCCLFLILPQLSQASSISNQPLKFKQLSIDKGLSTSYVYSITEDKSGFMWIATQDGLNRYDGENVVQYRQSTTRNNAITSNFIRKVFVDSNNTLWVGTQNGLNRYNRTLDNFDSFVHIDGDKNTLQDNTIWDIYEDNQNKLWVSTKAGLHQYSSQKNNFERINLLAGNKKIIEIKTIFQDENNNFWLGTYENGIYVANPSFSYIFSLKHKNSWDLNIHTSTLNDMEQVGRHYWLATNHGVYVIDKDYRVKSHYTSYDMGPSLLSDKIRSVKAYQDNQVFVATEHGLNLINLDTDIITHYQSKGTPGNLSENWLMDIFKDSNGRFWFATNGGGVNIFTPETAIFSHQFTGQMISQIASDKSGVIWFVSDENKLNALSTDGVITSPLLAIKDIRQMHIGNTNELWLLSFSNKLVQLDTQHNTEIEHSLWNEYANYNQVTPFIYLKNKIWFIDNDGQLAHYDTKIKQIKRFSLAANSSLSTLSLEQNSHLWSIDNNNLVKFSLKEEKFVAHNLDNLQFNVEASNIADTSSTKVTPNWLWLASNQGVTLVNRKNNEVSLFDEESGLTNNYINAILIDADENAWVSTNRSISVINPYAKTARNFSDDYSISDNEFLEGAALKAANNAFYFAGMNGFNHFIPEQALNSKQTIKPPVFTQLLIANKKIGVSANATGKHFYINKQLNTLKTLTLKHQQSPFSIEFISPNTKFPTHIKYSYRLKGLEEQWIEAGENNKRATYTNLSSGDYLFEIQAIDRNFPKKTTYNSLAIHILPPWWLSSNAKILYVLLSCLILLTILQQIRNKRQYHLQIQLSEERLKLSLWGSGDEMWDWNIKTGKMFRSNIWGILEFPQDGSRNTHIDKDTTNIHQQDIPRVKQALKTHFENNSEYFEATYRVKDKNNQWLWILDRGKVVEKDENNQPIRMTGTLKDISQIKQTEERLMLFAKCIENISDAVIIYDRFFNVVDVNKAFQRITGKSRQKMIGRSLTFTQYPEEFTYLVKKHLLTKGSWHGEVESCRNGKEHYRTDLNIDVIYDENKNISHYVGVFSDITKRKETEAQLIKLASSDTLTGLPNRSFFQANQERLVNKNIPHALLVFDLDNFKKINDSLGHESGDALLCMLSERIIDIGRKQDSVYRLGGDEFSLIIEDCSDLSVITALGQKILTSIAQPFKLKNQEVVLYSSIGIALYPQDGETPQELLRNADTAMYHAKDNGGNRYQFFNTSMNKKAVKRLQIESLIRHGLKEDCFSVFYQPKIEISTGKIAGMEALVRFETPKKGIISPVVFIPISEDTGQIIGIGEVVLRKSCFAAKKWVDSGLFDGRVAVNLSAVQFTQPNLVEMIAQILNESGLAPKHLELEITEGTVMDSPQAAIDTMLDLRKMGIHLSLDDFGTGYSSLAYLKKFPLNTLKIDKAFVDDIEQSEQGRNMVATIVTIAHNLGLHVVAEGVETNAQLSFLSGLRCEQLQGYLYSKPLPIDDFEKYLVAHQITNLSTSFSQN